MNKNLSYILVLSIILIPIVLLVYFVTGIDYSRGYIAIFWGIIGSIFFLAFSYLFLIILGEALNQEVKK